MINTASISYYAEGPHLRTPAKQARQASRVSQEAPHLAECLVQALDPSTSALVEDPTASISQTPKTYSVASSGVQVAVRAWTVTTFLQALAAQVVCPAAFQASQAPGRRGSARPKPQRQRSPEITVLEKTLPVTLEDLFSGTTKRLKINRKVYDERSGRASTQDKILEVPIKKGLRAGSKIKFSNVGDQIEGGTQDIHFVVSEREHEQYRRDGDDLRHDVEISLKEALTGWQRVVRTIDGKNVSLAGSGPTAPTWTERYPGLGMPKPKSKNGDRGDFVVGVAIKFPSSLTTDQKQTIKDTL